MEPEEDTHPVVLLKQLHQLYQRHLLTDVILRVEGRDFKAHAAVLVAFSTFFQTLLEDRTNPRTVEFDVQNTSAECMECILEYMYTGSLNLTPENVLDVQSLTDQLKMPAALWRCQQFNFNAAMPVGVVDMKEEATGTPPLLLDTVKTEDATELDISDTILQDVAVDGSTIAQGGQVVTDFNDHQTLSADTLVPARQRKRQLPQDDDYVAEVQPRRKRGRPPKRQVQTASSKTTDNVKKTKRKRGRPRKLQTSDNNGAEDPDFWLTKSVEQNAHTVPKKRGKLQRKKATKSSKKKKQKSVDKLEEDTDEGLPDGIELVSTSGTPDGEVYRCVKCDGKELAGRLTMKVHALIHAVDKSEAAYTCRHCGQNFKTPDAYDTHLVSHGLTTEDRHLEKTDPDKLHLFNTRVFPIGPRSRTVAWECQECGRVLPNAVKLREHITDKHPDVRYQCPHCFKLHTVKFTHERHVLLKHVTCRFMCDICGEGFVKKSSVVRHKHAKHKVLEGEVAILRCPEPGCNFTGYIPSMLSQHMATHVPQDSLQNMCDECGKRFASRCNLKTHIKLTHRNLQHYACMQCPERFKTNLNLISHMAAAHGIKPVRCQLCSYSTHNKQYIQSHMFSQHGIKPSNCILYKCEQCDYTALQRSVLKIHVQRHNTELNFWCTHEGCGKKFPTKQRRSQHVSYAHSTKSYRCTFCHYTSPQKTKIKTHIRTTHTHVQYKPYKCSYCEFTCATGGNCRKHIMGRHRGQEVKYIKIGETTPRAVAMLPVPCDSILEDSTVETPSGHADVTE